MNANAPNLASRTVDNRIDRALTALRDAQPRPGLESRILASLDHRAITPQPTCAHISARITLWAATSAALIAIASLLILHRTITPAERSPKPVILSEASQHDVNKNAVILSEASQRDVNKNAVILSEASPRDVNKNAVILSEASQRDAQPKDPETASLVTNPKPFSTRNRAQNTNTLSSRPEHRSLAAMGSGETCISDNLGCPLPEDKGLTNTPTDAQALADLHAPSHPAPPLPLTPQEKLFLRMAQYGNATELAELNPAVRAQHDAEETTAFKAFFPDPPPLKQPGDDE